MEKAGALTNTAAGLRATLLCPAHRQHRAETELSWSSPEQCMTFVRKHGLMQTIAGFPSNLFAFMKIQLKNMRICVCFHQLCNANKNGHQPNKVTCSGKILYTSQLLSSLNLSNVNRQACQKSLSV